MGKKKNKKKAKEDPKLICKIEKKEIEEIEDRKEIRDNKYHWRSVEDTYYNCNIDFKYFSKEETRYVSNVIGENDIINHDDDNKGWVNYRPVFISAQTGSGKNFFIKDVLIRLVSKIKENSTECRILLISNRVALSRQSKLDLSKALIEITGDNKYYEMLEDYKPQGIDKYCLDLGIITVCSYQQLYAKIANLEYQYGEYKYKYVVCDECHFFTGDALFNPCTDEILSAIVRNYQNAVRIYMSATLEDTFLPIIEKEYGESEYNSINCIYYYFERNYDYIEKIYVYKEIEQLVSRIKENDKSKWLIFVTSKSKGSNLRNTLQKEGVKVAFLTADSKANRAYQSIVETEKFTEQVLISTAVLDNGINIKDSEVKNVVIEELDRTEFIQMLGRIRITDNQHINLYIRDYSMEEVEEFLMSDVEKMITRLGIDFQTQDRNIFYNVYSDPRYKVQELFHILDIGKFITKIIERVKENSLLEFFTRKEIYEEIRTAVEKYRYFDYNPCAIYKLVERIATFMEILRSKDEKYFLPTTKLNKRESICTRLYNSYKNEEYPKNKILREHIYHILESKNNYNHRIKANEYEDRYYSFRNYFLVRMIKDTIQKTENLRIEYANNAQYIQQAILAENKIQHLKQQQELQEELLNLDDSEVPVLTEQVHWIGQVLNNVSDFEYLEEIKDEPEFTEKEVGEFLKEYAVKYADYESNLKKLKNRWSFTNLEILDAKGCLINKLKGDSQNPKVKAYQNIFKWFYEKYGIDSPELIIESLDDTPYEIGSSNYKLFKVRGTKTADQKVRYLFLEFEVKN